MSWIEVWGFELGYECNPETGEVRNARTLHVLKVCKVVSDQHDKWYHKYMVDLSFRGKRSKRLVAHIIAESVLRTDLHRVPIHHIDKDLTNNKYDNLLVGFQERGTRAIKVAEYKNNTYNKTYSSISQFQQETGVSPSTIRKKKIHTVGIYTWKVLYSKRKNNALLLEVYPK